MSTTIESLQLEISQNSQSAVNGIDALTQSLTKLRNATKGGLGLTSVAKQITSVGNAVNSINASTLNNISGLASAINTLSGVKISSSLGKNITSISTAINSIDMSAFKSKITQMTSALTPLATQMSKVTNGFSVFSKGANKVTSSVNTMSKSTNKGSSSFLSMGGKLGLSSLVINKAVNMVGGFIKKSSDYIEDVNLFTVAMGQYANEAEAYANKVSEIMGIDPGEWMRNQGLFQTLITGFGVAGDGASKMSKNLTQLAYDLSSFYNIDVETAMQKLKSGMAGELEPLRAIGYDLSQAKLEATAAELGIDKAVSSMTQAEKSMLRYHAIMSQVTVTHGDMARTLDQPANQLRILKAQWEMLSREIGNVFMPLLQKLLPYGIAVTKMLREMVSAIATFVGFEMPTVDTGVENLASGSEATEEALEGASKQAKKLKSYTMGIDELNVISPNDDSSGDSASSEVFDIPILEYDFLGDATNERIEGIITKVKELIQPLKEFFETRVEFVKGLDFEPMIDGFTKLLDSVKPIWDLFWEINALLDKEIALPIAGWVIEDALPVALNLIVEALEFIEKLLNPIIDGLKELKPVLEPIVSWLGDIVITVLDGLASIFEKLTQVVVENEDEIKGIIVGLGEVISALYEILKPLLDNVIPLIEDVLDIVGDLLSDVLKGAIDILGGIVDFVAGVFTGDWERAWDGIKQVFSGIWDIVVSIFESAWDIIVSAISKAWDGIVGIFTPVGEWFNENVIQPVVGFFKGLWESVSGFFVNLWEDIKGVWKKVSDWFDDNVVQPIVNFFAPIVEWISDFFEGCWIIIQAVWLVASTWFDEYVVKPIVEFFKALWEDISGFFTQLWDDIVLIWTTVSTWFNTNVITPVVDFFKGVWTSVSGFFTSLWDDIKLVWEKVSNWFDDNIIEPVKTAFEKACEAIGGFFSSLWLGIRQGVAKAMNGVIGAIESAINGVIGAINSLIGGFDKVVQWAADVIGADWGGISLIQKVSFDRIPVPTYAQGGFPDSGQAFIARENGIPEMVGTIGRRTAVANNDQIVESISVGVADANSEQNLLLREQNSLLRALLEKDTGVYLDGKSLSESVDKHKREQGRVIMGGAL